MRIFVDMDGTLAKWNNVEFEQLYEEGYYRNLEPNQKLVDEVNSLIRQGEDVYILSCYLSDSEFALKEKKEWCKEHLPELSDNKYIFVPFGESKAKVFDKRGLSPITNHDYLIDDYTKNLLEWKEMGGIGVKYLNGINNTKGTWRGFRLDTHFGGTFGLEKLLDIEKTYIKDNSFYSELNKGFYLNWRYPVLSECRDFDYLSEHLDSETLDDMEYTLYIYENSAFISPERYKYIEDNPRINLDYLRWYEGKINTIDLLKIMKFDKIMIDENNHINIKAIRDAMGFMTNNEDRNKSEKAEIEMDM